MAISYAKVVKNQYIFRQLTGLTTEEFEKIVGKVRPEWEKVEKQKKCHGRKSHIETLEDKILCVLIYYRTYITHPFLGFFLICTTQIFADYSRKWSHYWPKKIYQLQPAKAGGLKKRL